MILPAKLKSTSTQETSSQSITAVSTSQLEVCPAFSDPSAKRQRAETRESRKNGFGRARIDTLEHSAGGTATQTSPCRALWKYAANPYCRRSGNAHVRYTQSGLSRHKIVNRSYHSAMASISSNRTGNLQRFSGGNGADCRYGIRGRSIRYHSRRKLREAY
jgi:hypothetical protein